MSKLYYPTKTKKFHEINSFTSNLYTKITRL